MKNFLCLVKIILPIWLVSFCFSNNAQAMVVFDPSVYAKVMEEIREMQNQLKVLQDSQKIIADQKALLTHELSEVQTHTRMFEVAFRQLKDTNLNNPEQAIQNIQSVIDTGQGLAYATKTFQQNLNKDFPGMISKDTFAQQYQKDLLDTIDTLKSTLTSAGKSAENFVNESNYLKQVQEHIKNAKGEIEAVQAAAEIASAQVTQLQLLRQTMIANFNAQGVYYASLAQSEVNKLKDLNQSLSKVTTGIVDLHANPLRNITF